MSVNWQDIQATVGRTFSSAEQQQASLWIGDALTIIGRGPDGRTPLDVDALDQNLLAMVVREAVANRIKRPDSATQVAVTVDDGSLTRRYESGSGQIEILPEWWALLLPEMSGDSSAFSIRPAYPDGGIR